jgi:hypothetical protein
MWATAAEVAVLVGRPGAKERLLAAQPAADENDWAAACLARVRGRLTGDRLRSPMQSPASIESARSSSEPARWS